MDARNDGIVVEAETVLQKLQALGVFVFVFVGFFL